VLARPSFVVNGPAAARFNVFQLGTDNGCQCRAHLLPSTACPLPPLISDAVVGTTPSVRRILPSRIVGDAAENFCAIDASSIDQTNASCQQAATESLRLYLYTTYENILRFLKISENAFLTFSQRHFKKNVKSR